jgi:hypothetical protein
MNTNNKDKKSCVYCELKKDGTLVCKKTKRKCHLSSCPYNDNDYYSSYDR